MKIAVAVSESGTVSTHFGRSAGFIVYDVEDNKIVSRQERKNVFTAHAQGECTGTGDHDHHHSHGHEAVITALSDCSVILCGGMGMRAADELSAHGIRPFVIDDSGSPDNAVSDFLLKPEKSPGSFCRCSHR